jgi:hypothetical protein
MRPSRETLLLGSAIAACVGIVACGIAFGQSSPLVRADPAATALTLGDNEGIYVSTWTFKVDLGKAKGDPAVRIDEMGAKEVSHGAIIFRSGDRLYIVDGKPVTGSPQAMKSFSEEIWSQPRMMRSFDDAWEHSSLMR